MVSEVEIREASGSGVCAKTVVTTEAINIAKEK
jgi:hypothetical protein